MSIFAILLDMMQGVSLDFTKYNTGLAGCLDLKMLPRFIGTIVPTYGKDISKEGGVSHNTLETVADFNLWIWHDSFGLPGGSNDINIWEMSPLLKSMLNGTHSEINHPFEINNQTFH